MPAIAWSEALHSIGRDLEARGIKTFVIRCEPDLYIVDAGYQSPPAPTPVTLYYTLDDIEQLDREGREADNCNSAVKEFLSLSQILRAIGCYVGRKGARSLSVSNNALTGTMPVVKIEYETAQGERVVDDRTGSAIYDLCVSIYSSERKITTSTTRFRGERRSSSLRSEDFSEVTPMDLRNFTPRS
jgi:hypothetical protein